MKPKASLQEKNPRHIAYEILYTVNAQSGYSNVLLSKALGRSGLQDRDKGFITELVYGTLSRKRLLEHWIVTASDRPLQKLSQPVQALLQMGLYQLFFMDSVSPYAAIFETVKLSKSIEYRAHGFINAVLRRLSQHSVEELLGQVENILDKKQRFAIRYSLSDYIAGRFLRQLPICEAERLMEYFSTPPAVCVRLNRQLCEDPAQLLKDLTALGWQIRPQEGLTDVYWLSQVRALASEPHFAAGHYMVQDFSSMQAARLANARPGEKILDVCAAPGGKSLFMALDMKNQGQVRAADVSRAKLALLQDNARRLQLSCIEPVERDARLARLKGQEQFDCVFVDAPCSGFGILRRKPEIRYKNYEDVKELPALQEDILQAAATWVKPTGRLLYSTCTLEPKENISQVEKFLDRNPDFRLFTSPKTFWPHLDHCDGFFVARFEKIASW